LQRRRLCLPTLVHIYHDKRSWDQSVDGTKRQTAYQAYLQNQALALNPDAAINYATDPTWELPILRGTPQVLKARGMLEPTTVGRH
jgi:hypothetical protein